MNILGERPLFIWCAGPLVLSFASTFIYPGAISYLSLITANTLITHTYAWNLVTSNFFEDNILKFLIDIGMFWILTKLVGSISIEQFGLYFVFSLLASTLGASAVSIIQFASSGLELPLLLANYGCGGIIVALLMFVRHAHKSQPVFARIPYFTYHHLPTLFTISQVTLSLVGIKSLSRDILFSISSLLFSWSYLKFYYKFTEIDQPGDRGEDFTFVGMFPEAFHIVLIPFTTAFYNIMVLLTLFPPLEHHERKTHHHLRPQPSSSGGNNSSTSSTAKSEAESVQVVKIDALAERRRARAMKTLAQKFAELDGKEPEGWDDVSADLEINQSNGQVNQSNDGAKTPTATDYSKLKI